jgi:hypothetical protein
MEKDIFLGLSYKVTPLQGNTYQLEIETEEGIVRYQGSLEDCEAQINYMNSKTK